MSYIVPIHRPSGVRHAIKLNFLVPDEEAVIVAKANRLEIYSFSPGNGLTLRHAKSVYGYITMLSSLRPAAAATDHLFVGTDRYQYFTCSWDADTKQLKTESSYVDQADKSLRDSREHDRVHIDPTRRFMTLELFDGVISVVPIVQANHKRTRRESSASGERSPGSLGEPIPVRVEEFLIRSSAFLQVDDDSKAPPRLALLWEDNLEAPQLKIRELRQSSGGESSGVRLDTVAELRANLDLGVSHLIPVSAPYGGFLILGERTISYVDSDLGGVQSQALHDQATVWTCWTKVDDKRWLLADDYGRLFFLMLMVEGGGPVTDWRLDYLGGATRASSLVYLDEGLVFLGSHSGDSQVVQLRPEGVEIVQTFPNIGPIVDCQLMDLGRATDSAGQSGGFSSGQARIVTASGAWQDGSIRSVRTGVGAEEIGTVGPVPLIVDMWGLSSTGLDDVHDTLLATFVNETRVFGFDAEASVDEVVQFHGIKLAEATLLASNLPHRRLLQVHERGVLIADLEAGVGVFEWKPPDPLSTITGACGNGSHVVVVEAGHTVHVFQVTGQGAVLTTSRTFPPSSQVSGVTVSETGSDACIVAFWQTASVAVLGLESLDTLCARSLGTPETDVPRSVLVAHVLPDAPPTVFVAMADGTVVTFAFAAGARELSGMTRILLGTQPVFLKSLPQAADGGRRLTSVFASCEQPSLIYAAEGRILYAAVNSEKAARFSHLNLEAYPGAVAVASADELKLAMIGTTRTTQLQTLHVKETVRCISYEPRLKVFGMGCIRRTMTGGVEELRSSVKLASEASFVELDSFALEERELVECIASLPRTTTGDDDDDSNCLFVVGTSVMGEPNGIPAEERGRIVVFAVDRLRSRLKPLTQRRVKGACRSLAVADGLVVAGLMKVVVLFALVPTLERGGRDSHTLHPLASYRVSTDPLSLAVQPATEDAPMSVAVGDLMKSLTVLSAAQTSTGGWELRETARHFATVWSSAVAAVATNEWVVADMEGNLATLRRNPDAYGEEGRRLELTGEMRLGEVANRIVSIAAPASSVKAGLRGAGGHRGKARSTSGAGTTVAGQADGLVDASGALIQPRAFLATVEGSIYMLGAINPAYTDALIRLQTSLSSRVVAPGYMPWSKFRAWKTEVREAEEPFRFVDGEMMEQGFLDLPDATLDEVIRDTGLAHPPDQGGIGLSVARVRQWGEELRRLH